MSKKKISTIIKIMVILLALTGMCCCIMMPRITEYLLPGFSTSTHCYWLVFIYLAAIPCFAALIPAWLISNKISKNNAFCKSNARYMLIIARLMAVDSALIFCANIAFYAMGLSFFAFFVAMFLIFAIFFAISSCAYALSSLIDNATDLQEQSDLTI